MSGPARADPWGRPVLVAPDSFKGTFTAPQVAAAIGRGLERAGVWPPPDLCPLADGGEGTMGVLLAALGGETGGATVTDPLGRPVPAGFALIEDGGTAIVEVAAASGWAHVAEHERGPATAWEASTRGTGELIAAAVDAGAAVVLVCAGGSATTDGGAGAIAAIEERGGLRGAALVVLCDVRIPFERAADVFGPQKGADAATVARLAARNAAFGRTLPRSPFGVRGGGAAGGLAGGLHGAYGATLEPGAAFVLDALDADARMRAARAVVVGEGRLDRTSLEGKIAGELAIRARQAGVPAHAVVGQAAVDPFEVRILDLQVIAEATTLPEIEAAGERIAQHL
ncbi:glycerate kinase [Paraconexibacter algicola]|uniref:Glycerate kinase n=1 Tax=Paraconexibacter algicola TaxID=2133960 RepID=A0A2T4UKM9_9ACTN|nr:glycerate kinase [Paraconexibacter algicola]PTL59780.1 glycerate kinase [Paraconexibacter algicola]